MKRVSSIFATSWKVKLSLLNFLAWFYNEVIWPTIIYMTYRKWYDFVKEHHWCHVEVEHEILKGKMYVFFQTMQHHIVIPHYNKDNWLIPWLKSISLCLPPATKHHGHINPDHVLYNVPHLYTHHRVHVQPGQLSGLYHSDADLVVLRLQVLMKAAWWLWPRIRGIYK